MKTCKNCGQPIDTRYCGTCGQSSDTHDINFRFVIHEIQHSIFHIDRGILYTIKELCYRPGYAIKEYIDGKRIRYFKPVVFVLVLSTVYSLLEYSMQRSTFVESALSGFIEGWRNAGSPEDSPTDFSLLNWMMSHYAYTALLAIPAISLASYLAYARQKHNYFHHLVLNAYIAGQITFFYIILFFPVYFVPVQYVGTTDFIKLMIGLLYAGWVYFQFFVGKSVISRILCSILVFGLFWILFGFMMFLIMGMQLLLNHIF